jgi:murein DD-endopeptidase
MATKLCSEYVLRAFLSFVICFLCPASRTLAQSSARPSPVEVVVPKPPTPVIIEGKRALVYELHITNFGPSSLTLTQIQVFASGSGDSPGEKMGGDKLADYNGSSLYELLHPVDESSQMAESSDMASKSNPGKLDIGRRVIAFMYVTVPGDLRISALRHRFSFDVAEPSRSRGTPNDESALDGIIVPVLQQSPLVLSSPFKDGVWLAGNGPSNSSVHRRSLIAIDGRAYIAQRFAIDWDLVGTNGDIFHVTVRIAADVYVTFAHLKQGSIGVGLHEKIKRGAQLAQVGNSGNTTGAHLHLQVTDGNSALAAEGIPFIFDEFRFLGFGKDFEEDHHPDRPRSRMLPADDSVIAFP